MPAKPSTARKTAPKAARKTVAKRRPRALPPVTATESLADIAARNTLAVNPLIGIRASDLLAGARAMAGLAVTEPLRAATHLRDYAATLGQVIGGGSDIAADPKDKRFADPAWSTSPVYKRWLQAYLAAGKQVVGYIDGSKLEPRNKARAQLAASIVIDAVAPSNTPLNPPVLKRALQTRGASLLKGAQNLIGDLRHNHGLPSSVDKSKFSIGGNLCLSPGKVVFRNEVLELIQYQPQTEQVYQRPLLICPPQVNKFYALDLSPEKSLVRYATGEGLQVFAVSWRNPGVEHRDWDMGTYVAALDEAADAALQITGSPDLNLWGACSGGMTSAAYVAWLAAVGRGDKVVGMINPVCVLDPEQTLDTTMGLLISEQGIKALKAQVKRRGFVDGSDMARIFAWLRPNDLIWNYWVNNYLLGNDPPAFDILYWNADTTRLPAAFHADLLDVMQHSPFVNAGRMQVLGEDIDMGRVNVDAFVVAGITDHITPWKACYQTARIYGADSTFVLANAGHLQSLLNPPGSARSFFFSGAAKADGADAWAETAARQEGSWWPHWMAWMQQRSGKRVKAPKKTGSRKHKATVDAPGEYVMQT